MAELNYAYDSQSIVSKSHNQTNIALSHFNEDTHAEDVPCFFWGKLVNSYLVAKCLSTLAKVVQSRFAISWQELAAMRDPIVTAGNDKMRFEAFSSCNGVYARLDILPDGLDGEFLSSGTTNVDFNEPMINALNSISRQEDVFLSVGQKELILERQGEQVIERKVSLPTRWIKGLTNVQLYLAEMEEVFRLNKLQTIQLFQSLPKGAVKADYYLISRANKFIFSPAKIDGGVTIGGIHRIRLLEGLLPFIDGMTVYSTPDGQSTTFMLLLGDLRFLFSLSSDVQRGFSGEGKVLDNLVDDLPLDWIRGANSLFKANDEFNPTLFSMKHNLPINTTENLCANLSSIGLLGYDLESRQHFYRRLPFKIERILSLNPRLKNARKLLENNDTEILVNTTQQIKAKVKGTDVWHTVLIEGEKQRCTCNWFTDHQGQRGSCKHILSVKMLLNK